MTDGIPHAWILVVSWKELEEVVAVRVIADGPGDLLAATDDQLAGLIRGSGRVLNGPRSEEDVAEALETREAVILAGGQEQHQLTDDIRYPGAEEVPT